MPRRKANDGPAPPKAPRTRRKKVVPEEPKPEVYDPMNGYAMEGLDPNMYGHHPDYNYGNYGHPPPFGNPESSNSHYGMPPAQGNTTQPNMMMPRSQATPAVQIGATVSPLEFRIHDINRRLYTFSSTGVSENDQQQWWDAFSHEFFDDECKLWFVIGPETTAIQERERYVISRHFIPRFFRSIFDSGMRELAYVLRGPSRECTLANGQPAYENENVLQITKYDNQNHSEVHTEGKLYVEFTPYDEVLNYRIKAWTLELRRSEEYVFNHITKEYRVEVPSADQENQPKMGFFKPTLMMMHMLKILEPMQMVMSAAKSSYSSQTPRDIMRRTLFSHHCHQEQLKSERIARQHQMSQQMMMPAPEPEKPKPTRKRTRKPAANPRGKKAQAAAAAAAANVNGVPSAVPNPPPASNPPFPPNPMNPSFSQMSYPDVMVVGEPSMMGSDFGEDDERTISRVENSQYDPNAMQMQSLGQAPNSSMGVNGRNMSMPPPMGPPQHHGGMPGQQHAMPPHSMGSQMPNPMHNPMHMPPGSMPTHSGMPPMPSTMANQMPPPQLPPHTMSNQMPNRMPPPMQGQMHPAGMPGQMPGSMTNPNSMGGGIPPLSMPSQMPSSMSSQMPSQMPGSMQMNAMPPQGYTYPVPPPQWTPQGSSAMITG